MGLTEDVNKSMLNTLLPECRALDIQIVIDTGAASITGLSLTASIRRQVWTALAGESVGFPQFVQHERKRMSIAFGLDLAGFSTGSSAFARADRVNERIVLTIYRTHCFSDKTSGCDALVPVLKREQRLITEVLGLANLTVDVPIHLQDLPSPPSAEFVWQLTLRPADLAFGARQPLADRIGAPVARFLAVASSLLQDKVAILGENLFETYPAASLGLMKLERNGYKGHSVYKAGTWRPFVPPTQKLAKSPEAEANRRKGNAKNEALAQTLNTLGWTAESGVELTHDGFDAGLCALTGLCKGPATLRDPALSQMIREILQEKMPGCEVPHTWRAPDGYLLLRKRPLNVEVRLMSAVDDNALLAHVLNKFSL